MQLTEREQKSLLRDVENDAIDKSEWLSAGVISEIQKSHASRNTSRSTIAQILIRMGFLEAEHLDYASDYLELRNALYGALNANKLVLLKSGDVSLKKGNAALLYETINREIGQEAHHFIVQALAEVDVNYMIKHEFVANVYRLAFETLAREFDDALKSLAEYQ